MIKILQKLIIFISVFFVALAYAQSDKIDKNGDCFKGENAPFSEKNLKLAEQEKELIDTYEAKASDYHYQREYASEAIINAKINNDSINTQDLLLIKDCPGLDKKYPKISELERCKENLHDKMEDELALRFSLIQDWKKKCATYSSSDCNSKIDKYGAGLVEDLELEENSICSICSKVSVQLRSCKQGVSN